MRQQQRQARRSSWLCNRWEWCQRLFVGLEAYFLTGRCCARAVVPSALCVLGLSARIITQRVCLCARSAEGRTRTAHALLPIECHIACASRSATVCSMHLHTVHMPLSDCAVVERFTVLLRPFKLCEAILLVGVDAALP